MSPAMCVLLVTMSLKLFNKLSSNKFGLSTFFIIFLIFHLAFFFDKLIVLLLKTYQRYLILHFLINQAISKFLLCLLTSIVTLSGTDLVKFTVEILNGKFHFLCSVYFFFNISQTRWRNISSC